MRRELQNESSYQISSYAPCPHLWDRRHCTSIRGSRVSGEPHPGLAPDQPGRPGQDSSVREERETPNDSSGFPRPLHAGSHPRIGFVGPASSEGGLQSLRKRVEALPRNKFIVLYCGCCPWSHCPNVKPADDALKAMGFTNVKVLYIADNFGAEWVEKRYPVAKGD